jgi:hypothetical protein
MPELKQPTLRKKSPCLCIVTYGSGLQLWARILSRVREKYVKGMKKNHRNSLKIEPAHEDSSQNRGAGMPETGSVTSVTRQNHIND